jgi:hypothetical protein
LSLRSNLEVTTTTRKAKLKLNVFHLGLLLLLLGSWAAIKE